VVGVTAGDGPIQDQAFVAERVDEGRPLNEAKEIPVSS
jgi:hypothetical protein